MLRYHPVVIPSLVPPVPPEDHACRRWQHILMLSVLLTKHNILITRRDVLERSPTVETWDEGTVSDMLVLWMLAMNNMQLG